MGVPILAKRLTLRSRLSQQEARIDLAAKDLGRPQQEGLGPQTRPRPRPSLVSLVPTTSLANKETDQMITAALMEAFTAGKSPADTTAQRVEIATRLQQLQQTHGVQVF